MIISSCSNLCYNLQSETKVITRILGRPEFLLIKVIHHCTILTLDAVTVESTRTEFVGEFSPQLDCLIAYRTGMLCHNQCLWRLFSVIWNWKNLNIPLCPGYNCLWMNHNYMWSNNLGSFDFSFHWLHDLNIWVERSMKRNVANWNCWKTLQMWCSLSCTFLWSYISLLVNYVLFAYH